jgi:hypothetical protein
MADNGHIMHQWQGGIVYPNTSARMGLCLCLSKLGYSNTRIVVLKQLLQLPAPSLFHRKPVACNAPQFYSEQCCEKLQSCLLQNCMTDQGQSHAGDKRAGKRGRSKKTRSRSLPPLKPATRDVHCGWYCVRPRRSDWTKSRDGNDTPWWREQP